MEVYAPGRMGSRVVRLGRMVNFIFDTTSSTKNCCEGRRKWEEAGLSIFISYRQSLQIRHASASHLR